MTASVRRTQLDQDLLKKIAAKVGKPIQYIREQTSKRAAKLSVTSEAAQVLWAKELGLGTGFALRRLPPHVHQQVQTALPGSSGRTTRHPAGSPTKRAQKVSPAAQVRAATDFLLSDDELRGRCRDLLARPKHLDRVLREATTILENRIKNLSELTGAINPEPLVNRALNPDLGKAILLISTEPTEQAGFHAICRGIVLAFRHRAHHQLDDKVTPEHALKLCAFIDVLLDILGKATRRVSEAVQENPRQRPLSR